jgi:hypothetical protein
MKEITINVNDEDHAILANAYRITGRTSDEFAAVATKRYIEQYRKTGTGMTGEEFHKLLKDSTEQIRRFDKRFEANRQVENPNKKPALRIVR